MSEVLHLPDSECARARISMAGFVDDDLAADQFAWLRGHLESCAECRAVLAGFVEIDNGLTGWGLRLGRQHPPPDGVREQLASRLGSRAVRHRASRWVPTAVAALVAALAIAIIVSGRGPGAGNRGGTHKGTAFVEIPYLAPLDPRENATIVRMNISVATLITVGYQVTGDPDAMIPADVLVGEDGRAHAVRVISDIDWNGTGD